MCSGILPSFASFNLHAISQKRYRVCTQGLFHPCLKTFVPPIIPTRLTASGSPKISEIRLIRHRKAIFTQPGCRAVMFCTTKAVIRWKRGCLQYTIESMGYCPWSHLQNMVSVGGLDPIRNDEIFPMIANVTF